MSKDTRNEHAVDNLLKEVLKDDLPSATEFRMKQQLSGFRRALETSGNLPVARSAGWRRFQPVLAEWFARHPLVRKQLLAYVSAVMLATGAVIHLGGYQSVLADSISLLRISISLGEQIRLAGSMDCAIKVPKSGTETTSYHIRWMRDTGTRVDVEAPPAGGKVMWIVQGKMTGFAPAAGSPQQATNLAPALPSVIGALLSPAELAGRISESWQLQPATSQRSPDRLVFVDRKDGAVIEICFDRKSNLPISLSRKSPQASGTGGQGITAEFTWNQPMGPEFMTPRQESVR